MQDKLHALYKYNPDNGWLLHRNEHHKKKFGARAGFSATRGYRASSVDNKTSQEHRAIWVMHHGDIPKDLHIDHINGIKDDNRIENLRLVTVKDNAMNKRVYKNNTSGHHGITKADTKGKWKLKKLGKYIGTYATLKEAVLAKSSIETRKGFHKNHGT